MIRKAICLPTLLTICQLNKLYRKSISASESKRAIFLPTLPTICQLNKLYRKRPRGKGVGHGAGSPEFPADFQMEDDGGGGGGGGVIGVRGPDVDDGVTAADPYPRRPTTAMKSRRKIELLEEAMLELDSPENMPENCSPDIWNRMCQIRRSKVDSEQIVKAKG